MDKETNRRKFLWIYAVVLFSSAFAVLLLTAFSQIKLNNNIDEYEKKLSEYESKDKGYNLSLNTVNQEKTSLQSKLALLEKENSSLKSALANSADTNLLNRVKQANEYLLKADSLYRSEEKVSAAQTLKQINTEDLGEQGKIRYKYLRLQVYEEATKYFYKKGKTEFASKDYSKAKESFENSLSFDDGKYYEENSLYYLSNIYFKLGDKETAVNYFNKLKSSYPKSEYIQKLESQMN